MASSGAMKSSEHILLRELVPGEAHIGKALQGMVISRQLSRITGCTLFLDRQGTMSPAAVFSLQDATGNAELVGVLHVARDGVVGIVPKEKIEEMYPLGARVIILDPIVTIGAMFKVLVEHPSKLKVVSYFPSERLPSLASMAAAELRKMGNSEFERGRYIAALEYYALSLKKAAAAGGAGEEMSKCFLNKALCHLKMDDFEQAFRSSKAALDLDPGCLKGLFRLGQAYLGLQEYVSACEVIDSALEMSTGDDHLLGVWIRAHALRLQSTTGDYSKVLKEWFEGGCKGSPECSDFVGPVDIRMTPDGRGRGLFATSDVSAGSLLLVSQAASFESYVPEMRVVPAVVSKIFMKCIKSRHFLQQIDTLAETGKHKAVPPMHLFGPNRASRGGRAELMSDAEMEEYEPENEVDIERIEDMVHLSGYSKYQDDGKHHYCALWLLPSFMNNSCVPNVSKLDVGSTVFFHASRDVKAGEELTMCYFDVHRSWSSYRKERVLGWKCSCKRCQVEEAFDHKLGGISDEYEAAIASGKKAAALARLAPRVELAIAGASDEEKSFIRTSFAAAYVEYHKMNFPEGEVASPEQVMQDLRSCAPGFYRTVEYIETLSKMIGAAAAGLDDYSKWIGSQTASPNVMKAILKVKNPRSRF